VQVAVRDGEARHLTSCIDGRLTFAPDAAASLAGRLPDEVSANITRALQGMRNDGAMMREIEAVRLELRLPDAPMVNNGVAITAQFFLEINTQH
jgi:hypothetical protein